MRQRERKAMSRWQNIRKARTDITDYVVHLTRMVVDLGDGRKEVPGGFKLLKRIIRAGFLLPSFARRTTRHRNQNATVRGRHKAVCFSGQPLEQIPVTLRHVCADTGYEGYGIALHKADLFNYGGRPAIYGDESLFRTLDDEFKYRWVRYCPVRPGGDDPVDFTFEREWRSRVTDGQFTPWNHKLDGLPILLPDDFTRVAILVAGRWVFAKTRAPNFRIIVKWDTDVKELHDFINQLKPATTPSTYHRIYYAAVKKAQIISLEHVERKLDEGDAQYRRIEDLPFPDDVVPSNPKKKDWPFLRRS